MAYFGSVEVLSPSQRAILDAAGDVDRTREVGGEIDGVLKRGFYEWYRGIEEAGAVFSWTGVRGESLPLVENDEREKYLFWLYCFEIMRQSIPLTDGEINAGWEAYLNS